ncbi:MAG: hypothetical protein AB8F78_13960 [Saprospiraceae bacterium]
MSIQLDFMKTKRIQSLHPTWLLLPLFLAFGLWMLGSQAALLQLHPEVAWGILFDLLLTVPLLFFFIVRKTKLPNTLTLPSLFIGVVIAATTLPETQQGVVEIVKQFGIPLIEIGVVGFVIYQIRKNQASFKENWQLQPDFFSSCKVAFGAFLPGRFGVFMSTELSAFYYGLFHWKSTALQANSFTYHKRSGTPALIGALVVMVLVEMFAVHLLIKDSFPIVAILLLVLSGYTALQFLGFAKALGKRPIQFLEGKLLLRYGIIAEASIDLQSIVGVERITTQPKSDDVLRLSPLGELERVNVLIRFSSMTSIEQLYGKERHGESIALHVDEPDRFVSELEKLTN